MNKAVGLLGLVLLSAVLVVGAEARQYNVVDLGASWDVSSSANDINDKGQIVGNGGGQYPFIWSNGTFTEVVGSLGDGPLSSATHINNLGQVIGQACTGSVAPGVTAYGAYVWQNGVVKPLSFYGRAVAINDRGQILEYVLGAGFVHWLFGGNPAYPLPRGDWGWTDVNDSETVIGNSASGTAIVFAEGCIVPLDTPGYSGSSTPLSVNDNNEIVGWVGLSGNRLLAYHWGYGRALECPEGYSSKAVCINDNGAVVGSIWDSTGQRSAVVWDDTLSMLDTLGGEQAYANAINNRGQIVGSAQTATGEWHAVLWDPVTPEPASVVVFGAASLLGFVRIRGRRR